MPKILIAYFSRKGKNYWEGGIADLPVGNTELAAKKIQDAVGGDLFRIDPVHPYPEEYEDTVQVSKQELKNDARPALNGRVRDMDGYDVIILGYPNWCGTMPMPVFTFLESYDFKGKTIAPFCSNEGSGMGRSEADIRRLCPNAAVLQGLSIRGTKTKEADPQIREWLRTLGFLG
ncbi:MAG: flavodoxin [Christensenella sp.]|nr:flavodoxin [Christensenella sp.]